jgi:hypothetical protein
MLLLISVQVLVQSTTSSGEGFSFRCGIPRALVSAVACLVWRARAKKDQFFSLTIERHVFRSPRAVCVDFVMVE